MEEKRITASEEARNAILKSVIEELSARIDDSSVSVSNRELIRFCRNYVEKVKTVDLHIYHEIAEAALNLLIKKRYAENPAAYDDEPGRFVTETIKPLAGRLPTQTWRSRAQTIRQQFSTPPGIAFLL